MNIEKKIAHFGGLLKEAEEMDYDSKDEFDLLQGKLKTSIRKMVGKDSHYLIEIDKISYTPILIHPSTESSWRTAFNSGMKRFTNLISTIIYDLKLSTNYIPESNQGVMKNLGKKATKINDKEIHVLIASPSDLVEERELLLNTLETKFRKKGNETKCGYRIIVCGWEELASQPGYGQDIINNKIFKEIDIILSVFKHKLGTPTRDPSTGDFRSKSGTVEELLFGIKNDRKAPLGMAYFHSEAPEASFDSPSLEKDRQDWEELKIFKNQIKDFILYKDYSSSKELLNLVCDDLFKNIIEFYPQKNNSSFLERKQIEGKNMNTGNINTGGGNVNIGDKIN